MKTTEKPVKAKKPKQDYLDYLDGLRKSGSTNMFGARPWLMDAFPELDKDEAAEVLKYWMKNFK